MWKQARTYALAGLAVLLALVIAVYALLLNTGAGRRAVLEVLRPQLEESLGGPFRVGGTGGHWPHRIVLRDVTLADGGGDWLRLSQVSLRWKPLALLSGRIRIDDLSVPGGTLLRLPERETPARPTLPRLPRLPDLGIGTLTIASLDVKPAAAGRAAVLQVTGGARLYGDTFRITLDAGTGGEGGDRARVELDWAPAADRLTAEAEITGPEGGLIARMLGVGKGDVQVSLDGSGPASDWRGALDGRAGDLGRVSGDFRCDCRARPQLTLALDGAPGPALAEGTRRMLGESPHVEAVVQSPREGEWTAEVTALDVPAVALERPLRATLTDLRTLRRFDLTGALTPGPALIAEVPEALGETFEVTARGGFPDGGGIRVAELSLISAKARLETADLRVAADGSMTGQGNLNLLSTEGLPETAVKVLGDSAGMDFTLAGDYGGTLRIENVSVQTDAGTAASGTAAFAQARGTVEAAFDFTVPPAVFAAVTGLGAPEEAISGTLTAEGPLSALSATVQTRTPELNTEPRALPPVETTIIVTGSLASPAGTLTMRRLDAEEAPPLLSAGLAWPERQTLYITDLALQLDGMRLDGEARFEAASGRLTGRARLDAPDLAALSPEAAGSLAADIALEGGAAGEVMVTATASSPDLAYGGAALRDLRLSAAGPLRRLTISATAAHVTAPGMEPLADLTAAAEADLGEGLTLTVSELSAMAGEMPLALAAPARLTAAGGAFALPEAVFRWGETGRIAAAAFLEPGVLRLSAELERAAIPGRGALVSGFIRVDTNESVPGSLDLRLAPADGAEAALRLAGTWDGSALRLTGSIGNLGAQAEPGRRDFLRASVPLRLDLADGLSLSTGGDLDARLDYRGRLEPLLAVFLPPGRQDFEGNLTADIRIGGPLAAPRADGALALANGAYRNGDTGIELTEIAARLTFAGTPGGASGRLTLSAWDGRDAKAGTAPVTGEGEMTLDAGVLRLSADVRLREATLVRSRDLKATLSGDARLAGDWPELALGGDLLIDRLDLLIPQNGADGVVDVPVVLVDEKGEPLEPEADAEDGARGFTVALDMRVRSDGRAFIRGRGIDSEWKADLSAGGTIAEPRLTGPLTLRKGTVSFAGRRFTLTKGEVTFTGETPPDPALSIAAEYKTDEGTNAVVRVSGRTSDPSVELVSEPPLPRDQVMSLVLFGKPTTDLTALQALQVTQSVAQLTGTGPFGGGSIMDRARRTMGLDLLDLTFGKENGDVGLTIGRYLSKGVFVSATQDTTGAGGKVTVEVEVTDEFSVKTDVGQDTSGGVTAQWKKDY